MLGTSSKGVSRRTVPKSKTTAPPSSDEGKDPFAEQPDSKTDTNSFLCEDLLLPSADISSLERGRTIADNWFRVLSVKVSDETQAPSSPKPNQTVTADTDL